MHLLRLQEKIDKESVRSSFPVVGIGDNGEKEIRKKENAICTVATKYVTSCP